jgi:hypothetical protein
MALGFRQIIRGDFLVKNGAIGNWRFILFCTLLAIIMIASSHSADRKVLQIAELNLEVKELRSEFIDSGKRLMQLKMESTIARKMKLRDIRSSSTPPTKIIVKSKSKD